MSNLYDYGAKPINKDTAIAVSGGTHYERSRNHSQTWFKEKPILPEVPDLPNIKEAIERLVGTRRFRIVVKHWWSPGKWLCRCDCGAWVVRRSKSFSPHLLKVFDACPDCENVVMLKAKDHFRRTGKDSNPEDFA